MSIDITGDNADTNIAGTAIKSQTTNVTLTANITSATGLNNPTYQWYKGSEEIESATASTYSLGKYDSTKAGEYTCKVYNNEAGKGPSASSVDGTVTLTTTKLTLSAVDFQVTDTYTYSGEAQEPAVEATGTAATAGYIGEITVKTSKTDAGTYDAVISVAAGTDYAATTGDITLNGAFVIAQKEVELKAAETTINARPNVAADLSDARFSLDGVVSGDDASKFTMAYNVDNSGTTGLSTGAVIGSAVTATAEGTATITATAALGVELSGNYKFASGKNTQTLTLSVVDKTALNGTFTNTTSVYGSVAAPTYTPGAGQDAVTSKLVYKADGASDWSDTMPTVPGNHQVKAVATGESAGDFSESTPADFTVSNKPVTLTLTATKEYDGDDDALFVEVTEQAITTGALVDGDTLTADSITGAKYGSADAHADVTAGTIASATYTGTNASYYDVTLVFQGTITPKAITLGTPALSKPYDGTTDVKNVNEVTTNNNGTYTFAKTGAGTDGDPYIITITDSATSKTVVLTALTGTYGGKDVAPSTSVTLTGATLADGTSKAANYFVQGDTVGQAVSGTNSLTLSGCSITPANVTLAVNAAPSVYASNVSGGVKLSTLLNATGLVGTETLSAYNANFDSVLTRNDNGTAGNVSDDTWTATVNGQTFTVVFYEAGTTDPAATDKILAENATFGAGSYPFTLALGTAVGDSGNYTSGETFTAGTIAMDGILTVNADPVYSGGSGVSAYTVRYEAGEHGALAKGAKTSESVKKGGTPANVPEVVADEGYFFVGWTVKGSDDLVKPAETEITKSVTFVAVFAAKGDSHVTYVNGVGEGRFFPEGTMTRAEAAAMLARLHDEWTGAAGSAVFTDVPAGEWYTAAVTFAADKGIIEGRGEGIFDPTAPISRAEFSAMLCRFMGLETDGQSAGFSDTEGTWADAYITALKTAGVADGYVDGSFRPENPVARAEAVKLINRALGRTPDEELVKANLTANPFTDVAADYWAYCDIMEASVEHLSRDFHTAEKPADR